MKKLPPMFKSVFVLLLSLSLTNCSDDSPVIDNSQEPQPNGLSKVYTLNSVANPSISGTATVLELDDNSIRVDLDLQNTPSGGSHPAHIHVNTAAESGGIAISLEPVDGSTGKSTTVFTALDDGTPISYNGLLDFDGYINVHLSASELSTLVAQGDIGQNELTGTSKAYNLSSVAVAEIDGTATFYERVNGEALAVLALQNTPAGGEHPAHIHLNTAAEGGGIAFTFNPVNGDTGMSKTNVAQLDDNNAFGYSDVLGYNGYINVHLSAAELGTIVAQGDIGQNELTGNSKTYTLNTADVAGISGNATFKERVNGTTLITLALDGTPDGGSHPAHIHENNAATGGGIIATLNSVDGTTGISKTQISALNDGTQVSYTDLLSINGYINVHLSDSDLATIVAQGNIGANDGSAAQSTNYNVTNSGSTAYIFNDSGFNNASNPALTLERGKTYTFTVNATGHPFYIKSVQGTGTANAYNTGVTNNGTDSGTITFTVPAGAPATLYYNCEFHTPQTGVITIID